jgi:hypothetical protein
MNKQQNQLIKEIEKKCTTIMIGSLVRFEKRFGYLWDKEDEIGNTYYDLWQEVRHDVLNFGNHQIRDTIENLYKFFIDDKNNKSNYYEFRFDKQQGDKDEN